MKITIITGGESAERDISIKSAKNIANLIDFAEVETFTFPEEKEVFISKSKVFSIVIPVIHGLGGEDGTLQTFLNGLNIPFIFSDTATHQTAIDKTKTKEVVSKIGILCPKEITDFPAFVKPRFGGSSVASKL